MDKIEKLRKIGCDVDIAIKRCVGDTELYIELVNNAIEIDRYNALEEKLRGADWKAAFESAHALKGIVTNLSLEPLIVVDSKLTEELRAQQAIEYEYLLKELYDARELIENAVK